MKKTIKSIKNYYRLFRQKARQVELIQIEVSPDELFGETVCNGF